MQSTKAPIILLSRLSSRRLPGKALININGAPLIEHIINRLNYSFGNNWGLVATSTEPDDERLALYVTSIGVDCYRGSLNNVAERFMEAALTTDSKYVVRITGDSIFIDTSIINRLVEIALDTNADLVSNRKYQTYPIGQTVEVVNVDTYQREFQNLNKPEHFEHVTQFYYEDGKENLNIIHTTNPDGIHRSFSMAIDTLQDFELAKRVISRLGEQVYKLDYKSIENEYKRILQG